MFRRTAPKFSFDIGDFLLWRLATATGHKRAFQFQQVLLFSKSDVDTSEQCELRETIAFTLNSPLRLNESVENITP